MKGISILLFSRGKYGVLEQMTRDLAAALHRRGIRAPIHIIDEQNLGDLPSLVSRDNSDCTWSVNTIIGETCLYYPLGLPHICLSVDAVTYSHDASFVQPHLINLFVDRDSCELFSKLSPHPVFWFPHAIAKERLALSVIALQDRPYDVALIGSFIDHEIELRLWYETFSQSDVSALVNIGERSLADPGYKLFEKVLEYLTKAPMMTEALEKIALRPFAFVNSVERYARGLDRKRLLKALSGRKVHIFTSNEDAVLWSLKEEARECCFHDQVPFSEVIDICRHSKVVIQSMPHIHGYHERLFLSIASGAVTLVNRGIDLPESFKKTGRIVEYQSCDLADLVLNLDEVQLRPYDKGEILPWLEAEHSWDARLEQFLPRLEEAVAKLHSVWQENPFWSITNYTQTN